MCDVVEQPDFYNERRQRARKEHVCCACRMTIRRRDLYVYIAGKWDGELETYRHCLRCNEVFHWLRDNIVSDWDDGVPITLDCENAPLSQGAHPALDRLAFLTADEVQQLAVASAVQP